MRKFPVKRVPFFILREVLDGLSSSEWFVLTANILQAEKRGMDVVPTSNSLASSVSENDSPAFAV